MTTLVQRVRALDWTAIEAQLTAFGFAKTSALLTHDECESLIALYADERPFRKTIEMEAHAFGIGQYKYFAAPLPPLVRLLRTHAYRHLAPIANGLAAALGQRAAFPKTLTAFTAQCRKTGQRHLTPLLLRYEAGGYNRLHQDLYGETAFPLQMTCFLSRPGIDFGGGEFVLTEQRPRVQSRAEVVAGQQGELVIFASAWRPVAGPRGTSRATIRHGLARLAWGTRYALGIIFHDAKS